MDRELDKCDSDNLNDGEVERKGEVEFHDLSYRRNMDYSVDPDSEVIIFSCLFRLF